VQIFATAQQAKASSTRAASAAVGNCMEPDVKAGLQKTIEASVTLQDVFVKSVPAVGAGPQGFAQEVAAVVTYPDKNEKQQTATIYVEVVGFPSATALLESEFENSGSPPPKSLVTRTMTLLSKRAGDR
jgi:hypothetical protein